MLDESALDPALHDRAGFDCGVTQLNDYLQRYAVQHRQRGITSAFVLTSGDDPRRILGYYTLSAAEVDAVHLSEAERKKLPHYPVPCFRMGRLACRSDQRGTGLGRLLLGCVVDRCLKASEQVAAYALLVDAKNEVARAFYLHHGFLAFTDQPLTLYLPLKRGR